MPTVVTATLPHMEDEVAAAAHAVLPRSDLDDDLLRELGFDSIDAGSLFMVRGGLVFGFLLLLNLISCGTSFEMWREYLYCIFIQQKLYASY
jgi:hypothetical protein